MHLTSAYTPNNPCPHLQGQEQAASVSAQLAESQEREAQMSEALEAARSHLQAQHEALVQWQEWEALAADKTGELEVALEEERAAAAELRTQVEALRPLAEATATERRDARQQLELEYTRRADAEQQVGCSSACAESAFPGTRRAHTE